MPRPAPLARRVVSRRLLLRTAGLALGTGMAVPLYRATAQDATPAASPVELLWESTGDPALPLGNPAKVAIAPDDTIWVSDGNNHCFHIIAPDGEFLERWGTQGSGDGEIDFTTVGWGGFNEGAIAFAPDGSFYVADLGNYRIQKFGPDRTYLTARGSSWQPGVRTGMTRASSSLRSVWQSPRRASSTSPTRASGCRRSAWWTCRPPVLQPRPRRAPRAGSAASRAAKATRRTITPRAAP